MIDELKKLLGRTAYPLNKIDISQQKLITNYRYLRSINKKIKVVPVLKSNAYGHGIELVGKILDPLGVPFFCVDSIYEAFLLQKAKIKTPTLIMGSIDPRSLKFKKLPFSYAVWDLELAKAINKYQKGAQVHIFVDTGMHREGVPLDDLENFVKDLKTLTNVNIVGLMSHLASSGNPKDPQNSMQIKNFKKALDICNSQHIGLKYKHLSASAGLLGQKTPECNIARSGIALYGIDPIGNFPKLKPILKFSTRITEIKKIKKGDRVGYDGTYTAEKETVLGILPIGYNDGLDRRLSNKGCVLVSGIECPIIGMISMNITAIDLSDVLYPKVGDEVVVYSDNPSDKNSIQNTAKICATTPYDILVNLVQSTRREVV